MEQITFYLAKDFSVGLTKEDFLNKTKVNDLSVDMFHRSSCLKDDFILVKRKEGNILIAKDKILKITYK